MRRGHMSRVGGTSSPLVASCMQRHTLAPVVDLDRGRIDEHLDALADQMVRHRAAVAIDLDVIVDVDLGTLVPAVAVGLGRRAE